MLIFNENAISNMIKILIRNEFCSCWNYLELKKQTYIEFQYVLRQIQNMLSTNIMSESMKNKLGRLDKSKNNEALLYNIIYIISFYIICQTIHIIDSEFNDSIKLLFIRLLDSFIDIDIHFDLIKVWIQMGFSKPKLQIHTNITDKNYHKAKPANLKLNIGPIKIYNNCKLYQQLQNDGSGILYNNIKNIIEKLSEKFDKEGLVQIITNNTNDQNNLSDILKQLKKISWPHQQNGYFNRLLAEQNSAIKYAIFKLLYKLLPTYLPEQNDNPNNDIRQLASQLTVRISDSLPLKEGVIKKFYYMLQSTDQDVLNISLEVLSECKYATKASLIALLKMFLNIVRTENYIKIARLIAKLPKKNSHLFDIIHELFNVFYLQYYNPTIFEYYQSQVLILFFTCFFGYMKSVNHNTINESFNIHLLEAVLPNWMKEVYELCLNTKRIVALDDSITEIYHRYFGSIFNCNANNNIIRYKNKHITYQILDNKCLIIDLSKIPDDIVKFEFLAIQSVSVYTIHGELIVSTKARGQTDINLYNASNESKYVIVKLETKQLHSKQLI